MKNLPFDEYILFLKDAMENVADYGIKVGKFYPRAHKIIKGLEDPDPFVMYEALKDASLILEDDLLYH